MKRLLAALGLGPRQAPRPAWTGPLYESPLHRWLDAAGFPWRTPRADLIARYGVHPDPAYKWPVLSVPTPLADGLFRAMCAHADPRYPLSVPATEFTGSASLGADARANVRHIAGQLIPHLGPVRLEHYNNTFQGEWTFGRSLLRLRAWPTDLNRDDHSRNDAHATDPRLRAACHITLETGFRPEPSPQERAWLESFAPIAAVRAQGTATRAGVDAARVSDLDLGVVRELPEGLDRLLGHIGLSGDGQALIACDRVLWLLPLSRVTRFRIDQYTAGRSGPGGAYLFADYTPEQKEAGLKPLGISWEGPDTAEQLAARLVAATGKSLEFVDAGTED